jgi:hypothetical protein
MMVKAALQQ